MWFRISLYPHETMYLLNRYNAISSENELQESFLITRGLQIPPLANLFTKTFALILLILKPSLYYLNQIFDS